MNFKGKHSLLWNSKIKKGDVIVKKQLQGFVVGVIITVLLMSSVATGQSIKQKIEVVFNSVNLTVNGQKVVTDNISYNGTTYVPLRRVAEILGKEVGWDANSNTASINDKGFVTESKKETKADNSLSVDEKNLLKQYDLEKFLGKKIWIINEGFVSLQEHGTKKETELVNLFEVVVVKPHIFYSNDKMIGYCMLATANSKTYELPIVIFTDKQYVDEDPYKKYKWSEKTWNAIKKNEVFIGMNKDMVLLSWGKPSDINRTIGSWGTHEQWVYHSGYLYFENDKLTAIQD